MSLYCLGPFWWHFLTPHIRSTTTPKLFIKVMRFYSIEFTVWFTKRWHVWLLGNWIYQIQESFVKDKPVADLGFSPGGGASSQKHIIFQIICWKLHENYRIWTPGVHIHCVPLWSANASHPPNAYMSHLSNVCKI